MRMGILGGTFDPIHNGHLFVAEEARTRFDLDKVLFIPNGQPPHKGGRVVTPALHRYNMTRIGTHANPGFASSPTEVTRGGVSYTVDTLRALRVQEPETELFYITGVDAIAELLTWKRPEEVIRLATFIAATRPGFDLQTLKQRLPVAYLERILLLNTTSINISSTEIRTRLAQGQAVRYMLPDGVLEYIRKYRLYGAAPSAEPPAPDIDTQGEPITRRK